MTAVRTSEVPEPPRPTLFSNARVVGGQFFTSGLHAGDGAGGVLGDGTTYDQTRQVLRKIRHLIAAAGGEMDDIVTLRIYVTDITEKAEVSRARAEFFTGDFPCSTLVETSALVEPGLTVEIEAQAILGSKNRPQGGRH